MGPTKDLITTPYKLVKLMNVRGAKNTSDELIWFHFFRVILAFQITHFFCEYRLTGRLLVLVSLIFSLREEAGVRDVIAAGNFVDPTIDER